MDFNLWHLSDNNSKDIYAILEQQLLCLSCQKRVLIPYEMKNHHSSRAAFRHSFSNEIGFFLSRKKNCVDLYSEECVMNININTIPKGPIEQQIERFIPIIG